MSASGPKKALVLSIMPQIRNAFIFMGDPPDMGDAPTASSLSDVTSSELIEIVSGMNRGLGLAGNKLYDPT